jgi:hypothetical protein
LCRCSFLSGSSTPRCRFALGGSRRGAGSQTRLAWFGRFYIGQAQSRNRNAPMLGQDQLNVLDVQNAGSSMVGNLHGLLRDLFQKVVGDLQDLLLGLFVNRIRRIDLRQEILNALTHQGCRMGACRGGLRRRHGGNTGGSCVVRRQGHSPFMCTWSGCGTARNLGGRGGTSNRSSRTARAAGLSTGT